MYACLCVHGTAETLDGVAELPDTQTALVQTDVKETYCQVFRTKSTDRLYGEGA